MACIALGESASASRMGQGHIEHDWRVCWPMKDRYAGDPALCAKRVRRSSRYGRGRVCPTHLRANRDMMRLRAVHHMVPPR